MAAFQEKFPNIEFEIGSSLDYCRDLLSRRYDIVIAVTDRYEEGIEYIPLFKDQMVCVLPKGHPLSGRPFIRLSDFGGASLIFHSDKSVNPFYQRTLKPNGIEPKHYMTVGQPQAILELVSAGFGTSIVPGWAVRSLLDEKGLAAVPVTPKGLSVAWHAAFLKQRELPVFQREFINSLSGVTDPGALPV